MFGFLLGGHAGIPIRDMWAACIEMDQLAKGLGSRYTRIRLTLSGAAPRNEKDGKGELARSDDRGDSLRQQIECEDGGDPGSCRNRHSNGQGSVAKTKPAPGASAERRYRLNEPTSSCEAPERGLR